MKKRHVWALIGVMFVTFVVLLILQIYWLHSAYTIKEAHFDRTINSILETISKELETEETIVKINSEVYSVKNIRTSEALHFFDTLNRQQKFAAQSNLSLQRQIIDLPDTAFRRIFLKTIQDTTAAGGYNIDMDILKTELAKRLTNKTLFIEKIVNQLLKYDDHIDKRIDTMHLNRLIHKYLNKQNIPLHFEFGIMYGDSLTAIHSPGFLEQVPYEIYKTELYPHDVFSKEKNYLYVYFPKKKSYLLKSLVVLAVTSFLLVFVILAIFLFNLYVIIKQKRLSNIKNDFVNNMTHELKTPISTISLAASLINEKLEKTTDSQVNGFKKYVNIIIDEAYRLQNQVEKVLKIALLENGTLSLKEEPVHLNDLIKDTVSHYEILMGDKNCELQVDTEAKDDLISGDKTHLKNIITNLLDNAIKYSTNKPEIQIKTSNPDNISICFSIKDNGIGIDKKYQRKIFEKFYRVPTGNIHNAKGFGIGLSYVKDIVLLHKGTIAVKSEPGKGTVFYITLPLIKKNK